MKYFPITDTYASTLEKNLRNATSVKNLSSTRLGFVGTWLASMIRRETTFATFAASVSVSCTISNGTYKDMTNPRNLYVKFAEKSLGTVIVLRHTSSRSMVLIPLSAMSGTYLSRIVCHHRY